MRLMHICLIPFLLMLTTGCTTTDSQRTSPAAYSDDAIHSSDSAVLHVRGMSCPKCVTNVDLQLLAIPGVSAAHVDMGAGTVTVAFDRAANAPRPSQADLAKAVDRAGFTLAGIDLP